MVGGAASVSGASGPGHRYRPHLDGLRAVAVYLVVAFHAGAHRWSGGFIGVDVFFVLSGYLVTQLLVRDVETEGRIRFATFYSRRFRRLLPAAFAALLVTGGVFAAVAPPTAAHDAVDAIRAAFVYVANWHFIAQEADYFAAGIQDSPVVHFWSLAIEEQFYVLWPIALAGLVAAGRRIRRRWWGPVRLAVAAGAVASATAAVVIGAGDVTRAYYGTDTRAYQLLLGAFLALTPALFDLPRRVRSLLRWAAPFALAGLVVLATSLVEVGPIGRGLLAAALTALLLVAVENVPGGLVGRALSVEPLTYLGKISYGTYLWHWPVIVIAATVADPGPFERGALATVVGTGIASLSFHLLEQPIRRSPALDRVGAPVVATGLAVSILAAVVVVPRVVDPGRDGTLRFEAAASAATSALPADVDWEAIRAERFAYAECLDGPVEDCVVVSGDGPRIALLGDSHARMLQPAVEVLAEELSATVISMARPACPWQDGVTYTYMPENQKASCEAHRRDWYDRVVPELAPDLVVVVGRPYDDPVSGVTITGPDGRAYPHDSPRFATMVAAQTEASVTELLSGADEVLLVEPLPAAPLDPLDCLSSTGATEPCRYVTTSEPTPVEEAYRDLADGTTVVTLDADGLVCPYAPICDPILDGTVVKRDAGHLTTEFSESLADELAAIFEENGLLE